MNSKRFLLAALLLASPACAQDIQNPVQGANPSATIGAAAVNGSLPTYMRSDAAPPLPATLPALSGANLTALNASAITSGVTPAANGGAGAINGALKANGSGVVTQANCASLSDAGAGCSGAATATGANPTATIAAAAVNGSAATFMRSDGAPALPTSLAPSASTSCTIIDNGGGGLTFAATTCSYNRVGNNVCISGTVTYPATADTHVAAWSWNAPNTANRGAGGENIMMPLHSTYVTSALVLEVDQGAVTSAPILNLGGTTLTNAVVTGATFWFNGCYSAS